MYGPSKSFAYLPLITKKIHGNYPFRDLASHRRHLLMLRMVGVPVQGIAIGKNSH
jgi:hypothetical protein